MPKRQPREADLAHLNRKPTTYGDGSIGVHMPFDAPIYVRAYRLMQDTKDHEPAKRIYSQELKGHTLEVDCFTFGVKVYVRVDRSGNLKVITEDSEGAEVVAEYQL